jgi:hypothetical protein
VTHDEQAALSSGGRVVIADGQVAPDDVVDAIRSILD